jgi:hypothetical protein
MEGMEGIYMKISWNCRDTHGTAKILLPGFKIIMVCFSITGHFWRSFLI